MNPIFSKQIATDLTSLRKNYVLAVICLVLFFCKILPTYMLFPVAFTVILYSLWQLGKSRLKPCPVTE
jgi:hypothetical protein